MIKHLSYSSISCYLECPRRWKLRYIDKLETPPNHHFFFGSAWHSAIEEHLKEGIGVPLAQRWLRHWQQVSRPLERELALELAAVGAAMAADSSTLYVLKDLRPTAIERKIEFRVPNVGVPIIGYIDLVLQNGVLVDLKTAGSPWDQARADAETQPAFYLAATGGTRFQHIVFVKSFEPEVQVLDTQRHNPAAVVYPLAQKAWKGISAGDFHCNVSACSGCDYRSVCKREEGEIF